MNALGAGDCLVAGAVAGAVEFCDVEVSAARIDPMTGILHEPGHPLDGHCLARKVLVCRGGKGSSSGSYVLLNLARRGLAPTAILVAQADAVLVAGAVLGDIALVGNVDLSRFHQGQVLDVGVVAADDAPGLILEPAQAAALSGRLGRANRLAMRMLVAVCRACGADALIPVASAHVGLSLSSMGAAGVEFLESLAAEGVRFSVPTTTNVLSFERTDRGSDAASLQHRALDALVAMGASANCSCNPFAQGHVPRAGEAVAWSESATAPYVNGVLGARTNREGATALASAITGVTPRYGMHLTRGRAAGTRYRLSAGAVSREQLHLLGVIIGRDAGPGVPTLDGLDPAIPRDWLFGFSASLATYSTAAMFHAVGITPEAPSLAALYPDGVPDAIDIGEADFASAQLRWAPDGSVPDFVVLGCPHATRERIEEIRRLLEGVRVRPETTFFLHTHAEAKEAARRSGDLEVLEAAGVRVTADTCMYVSLARFPNGATVMTDSAKMAFLLSTRGLRPALAGVQACVRAASLGPRPGIGADPLPA
ncbi:MAG: aconitase X [Lautropia sp.]